MFTLMKLTCMAIIVIANVSRPIRIVEAATSSEAEDTRRSKRKSEEGDNVIFKKDCIFCNKEGRISVKKDGVKTTEGLSVFDKGGGPNILAHAEFLNDTQLLTRIRGYDLFSCEAKYHQSCRKKFLDTKRDFTHRSCDENRTIQHEMELVHQKAFDCVRDVILTEVIQKQVIQKFSILVGVYRGKLKGTQFENDSYRSKN